MRTTLDIDDDVLLAAKERARREHKTTGEVISDLARQSLVALKQATVAHPKAVYGFKPFAPHGRDISDDLIDKLRSDDAY